MKDPIVQVGDPLLRQKAKPLPKKDFGSRKLSSLLKEMKGTLAKEDLGVALAAPQIGQSLRIFLVSGKALKKEDEEKRPPDMVFINPEVIRMSRKKVEMSEGCLSVRDTYGSVLRHERMSVRAFDEKGKEFTYHGSGLLAHIFQHEMDHLNGILYIDKAKMIEHEEPGKKEKRPADL